MDDKLSNLQKAMRILRMLGEKPYEYTASEISTVTGLNRTTVYRILNTLSGGDAVIQDALSKKFKVGPMIYHIGNAYLNNYSFKHEIISVLQEISDVVHESAGLAIRDGENIISLFEVEMQQPYKMNAQPGSLYPMNRGCYGKCLMAYNDQHEVRRLLEKQTFEKLFPHTLTGVEEILEEYRRIRAQGYVISDGESYNPSAFGVGVPVRDERGTVKACLAVAFIKGEHHEEKVNKCLSLLLQKAEELRRYIP